jgi:uncharacterized protein (DUF302 family)
MDAGRIVLVGRADEHAALLHVLDAGTHEIMTLRYDASVDELLARIVACLDERGLEVFAVIDHSGEAREAGLEMPATKLVLFGSPTNATPLMVRHPLRALDLPLKLLVWETLQEGGFVSYLAPSVLGDAHGLAPDEVDALEVVESVAHSLRGRG